MLERQHAQLIPVVQELYKRLHNGPRWTGQELEDSKNGQPLIHKILKSLSILKSTE